MSLGISPLHGERNEPATAFIFVSKEYRDRKWTVYQARSAQARAPEERGNEYILPIRVDDIELEGLLPPIVMFR